MRTPGRRHRIPAAYRALVDAARAALKRSYSPYSRYRVGAAVLARGGAVYHGANVENVSYGLSCCAERIALYRAIVEGERGITAVAIAADGPGFPSPCGACRQVLSEFGKNIDVIMAGRSGKVRIEKLSRLLPAVFGPSHLGKK